MECDKQLLKEFQSSWAHQKYWVMSRSQQSYNAIRQLAKGNVWNSLKQTQYETILKDLESTEPTDKTLTVTFQHIWGYFKKNATKEEREEYLNLMMNVSTNQDEIQKLLKKLTETYQEAYLQKIRWIEE